MRIFFREAHARKLVYCEYVNMHALENRKKIKIKYMKEITWLWILAADSELN